MKHILKNMNSMDSQILKYCKEIRKKHLELLRLDKRKGVWYWDLPACASICHNGNYSRQKRGYSHRPQGTKWNDVLKQKMERVLGEIGTKSNIGERNYIGNCAEQHSGNNYLNKYGEKRISALFFSETVRPRTMEIIPPCENCKKIFDNL